MKLILLGFVVTAALSCLAGHVNLSPSRADALEYFTKDELERADAYSRTSYLLFFARVTITLAFILVVIYTGAAARFDEIIAEKVSRYPLRVLLYFTLFFVIYTAVMLPLSYYRSFVVEHRYGFSNQTPGGWLGDFLKGGAISLLLGAVLVVGLYWLLKASPRWWWLIAAGAFAVYLAAMILLKPVIIDPVFNSFTPMQEREFKTEIVTLAKKAGIDVGDVLVMDASRRTSHTNAYFTGFGHTKRIVLYDTLLEKHTRPEVLSVIAHEIGHWKYAHIYKGFFMALAGTLLVLLVVKFAGGWLAPRMPLGTDTLASPATIPLLFLILYICSLVAMPIENAISRGFERQADGAALELTGDGGTFVRMQVKLARANASNPAPPPFFYYLFYSHPSAMERIAAGEEFKE